MQDDGEATLSGRYGQQVWGAHANDAADKWKGVGQFMFNSLAPAIVRKGFRFDMTNLGTNEGVLPAAYRKLIPKDLADTLYSFEEQRRLKADRGLKDEIIGAFIRSPQVIPLEGPLNGIFREYNNALGQHNRLMGAMRTQMEKMYDEGNEDAALEIEREMAAELAEFEEKWAPVLTYYEEWTGNKQENSE